MSNNSLKKAPLYANVVETEVSIGNSKEVEGTINISTFSLNGKGNNGVELSITKQNKNDVDSDIKSIISHATHTLSLTELDYLHDVISDYLLDNLKIYEVKLSFMCDKCDELHTPTVVGKATSLENALQRIKDNHDFDIEVVSAREITEAEADEYVARMEQSKPAPMQVMEALASALQSGRAPASFEADTPDIKR